MYKLCWNVGVFALIGGLAACSSPSTTAPGTATGGTGGDTGTTAGTTGFGTDTEAGTTTGDAGTADGDPTGGGTTGGAGADTTGGDATGTTGGGTGTEGDTTGHADTEGGTTGHPDDGGGTTGTDDGGPLVYPDGENHPCASSESGGSNDADVTMCVCDEDAYCCNNAWDFLCTSIAQNSCAVSCDCETLGADELKCESDDDCNWCAGGDACAGKWTCDAGTCVGGDPVVCDAGLNVGCVTNECNSFTGECELNANHDQCADEDVCTTDTCGLDDGECTQEFMEGCGENHPCKSVSTPGTKDEAIQKCVCEEDVYCCNNAWDSTCVGEAKELCELTCNCTEIDARELTCTENSDCGWCDGDSDLCNGTWTCEEGGKCVETPPVKCDTAADEGCVTAQCIPFTGVCEKQPDQSFCQDCLFCTSDSCDAETGKCLNDVQEECVEESATCADKCDAEFNEEAACQCDPGCFGFGDCCHDICELCSAENADSCGEFEMCVPGGGI